MISGPSCPDVPTSKNIGNNNPGLLLPLTNLFLSKLILSKVIASAEERANIIKLIIMIVRHTECALTIFKNRELHLLDPLVGETSCQLRVAKLLTLDKYHREKIDDKMSKMIVIAKVIHEHLISLEHESIVVPTTIGSLIKELGDNRLKIKLNDAKLSTNFYLSPEEQFIVLSRVLTLTRDVNVPMETNAYNFMQVTHKTNVAPDSLSELVKYILVESVFFAKSTLANLSLEYLSKHMVTEMGPISERYKKVLVPLLKSTAKAAGNINVSPCFYNITVLMKKLIHEKAIIVLKIKRLTDKGEIVGSPVVCALRSNGTCFERLSQEEISKNGSASVATFEGVVKGDLVLKETDSEYLQRLLGEDDRMKGYNDLIESRLAYYILANSAAHPQYAGEAKNRMIYLMYEVKDILQKIYTEVGSDISKIPSALASYSKWDIMEMSENIKPVVLEDLAKEYILLAEARKFAQENGLCHDNPSLFDLKHIYNDILGHAMKEKTDG